MSTLKKPKVQSRIYLALMIGPDMSGKTTFSSMAKRYFLRFYPDFWMDILFYDSCPSVRTIYEIKNYVVQTVERMRQNHHSVHRRVIVVDARNMHDAHKRFNIFLFCLMFDIIYLQIYMQFDPNEVLARCARSGLYLHPRILENPEYFNTTTIGADVNKQWHCNSITILKNFRYQGAFQINRLHNFLLNCIPPRKDSTYQSLVPVTPLEYDNPHKLQMQAGISYKDKLLHGEKKKENKTKSRRFVCY